MSNHAKLCTIRATLARRVRQPTPDPAPQGKHPSHSTRSSDASSYDEVCINCGATDIAGGGWGKLAQPCSAKDAFDAGQERPQGWPYLATRGWWDRKAECELLSGFDPARYRKEDVE